MFRVASCDGHAAIAKVLDASMVDRLELEDRLDVTTALAGLDPRVCRPLLIGQQRVTRFVLADDQVCYVVCFELADGQPPDPAQTADAERMGATLCQLHKAMSQLGPTSLPMVAALRSVSARSIPFDGPGQLLHGDFNASNLREAAGVLRIFDLDDCGYGPPAFDVANALYMVLFDADVRGDMATYQTFRPAFLSGYASASGPSLADDIVDRFIELRVQALRDWLDDLDSAPIGIRVASPAWHATLRSFVARHRPAV